MQSKLLKMDAMMLEIRLKIQKSGHPISLRTAKIKVNFKKFPISTSYLVLTYKRSRLELRAHSF